jgi:hypothetical protein
VIFNDNKLILLDADGVLVDYHEGYARAWEKAFGYRPKVRDTLGYHPRHYWDVPDLSETERDHLNRNGFTADIWGSMPAMPGAVEACELLQDAGYRLECLTALRPVMRDARAANLAALGFRLSGVTAVGPAFDGNPKQAELLARRPVAFVDDLLPYLQGLHVDTWRALIDVRPNNSPNKNTDLEQPHSRHDSLLSFARMWVARD